MRVAIIYDDLVRPDTTGVHCRAALEQLCEVEHFRPDALTSTPATGFDLYLNIDDGLRYRFPPTLRPSAWWVIDTHLSYDWDRAKAEDFDYVFAAQRDGAERLRADGLPNVEWLPLACDPRFHRRHDVEKTHDVCFIGALIPGERQRLLGLLQGEFGRVFVGRAYWEEMAREYSRSRIVFNRSIANDVNMRVFEAVACGSLLVTNDLADNGLEELLRNGEHLVTYRDDQELLERVRYYLEHEDEREEIARRGMEEAHAKHTYRHRMQRILDVRSHLPSKGRTEAKQHAPLYYQFPRPDLLALIPPDARTVLDVGCGAGRMGEALKRRQAARAVGVEMVPEVAEEAGQRLDEVVVGDIESLELPFPEAHFDCIVCGDILEHLRDPQGALRKLVRHLQPDGRLVASIPNVRNAQVICDLMAGRWQYRPAGILDEGHLRFFTLAEIRELFRSCGLMITGIQRVFDPQHQQWAAAGRPPNLQLGALGFQARSPRDAEELFVEQYLVKARPCAQAPAPGMASIIIPVWNQLDCTKACLESLREHTTHPHEAIVVDNGSDDETRSYLATLDWVKVIRNEQNEGFVKACNQGIEAAAGDYLVLLNNDTIVTDRWLSGLVAVAGQDENIGMLGPVSNNVSGPQQIATAYRSVAEMHGWAEQYTRVHAGQVTETERLVGFCLLIKREVLEYIGLLDERYGLGLFDDDDLCLRARRAGYRLVYTPGVFVHHFGSRTLATLGVDAEAMLHENWRQFRAKWEGEPGGAEELGRLYPSISERVPSPIGRQRGTAPLKEPHRLAPRRIAVVSLLFNWPSTGGGNMDTAGLVRALGAAGHRVAHFYARIPAMGVGNVSGQLGTPSQAVELGPTLPSRSQVEDAFRQAVASFAPDAVIITDSWTCKPFLARALSGYPYLLRFQALEGLCPLNGARFVVQDGETKLCPSHLLLDPAKCEQCLRVHQSRCGPLHVAERAISGAGAGQAYVNVLREALANATGVLVYNPLLAATLAPYSPVVRVATPGVDLEQLQRAAPLGDPVRKVVLLPSLWTEGLKGYHVLAEACTRLRRQRDDFELRVAGPNAGPVNEWTTCVGWYPQDHLAELYGQADIVVVPSVWEEPFGIVAAEGSAAGRPVVASRVGGLQSIVEDGVTGFLFEPGDASELADRLARLLEDAGLRLAFGRAGRGRARQLYAWDEVVRRDYEPVLCPPDVQPDSRRGARATQSRAAAGREAGPARAPEKKARRRRHRRSPPEQAGRPTISLCMIARDEEANIANCLTSIKPWVDEMVVVDTGSEDRTPEIARECGARVEHFEWCDDFSAARNESLRHATGDWIFWMDADDVIDEANGRRLRELVASASPDVFGITARVHCLPRPGEDAGVEMVDHVKLLRNHRGVQFELHIHEQVLPSIRRLGKQVAYSDVYVTHAGYDVTPEGQRRKRERDLRLLRLDLASRPEHPFVHFNIGMTAFHIEDLDLAAHHLQRSIDLAGPSESHLRKAYALLAGCHRRRGAWDDARRTCDQGLTACPDDPELLFSRGMVCHQLKDFAAAEESYRRILDCRAADPYLRSVDAGIAGFKTRHNLAMLYRDMGRGQDAEQQLREAVAEEPAFLPSWFALADLLRTAGRAGELDGIVADTCWAPAAGGVGKLVRARAALEDGRDSEALGLATEALAAGVGPNLVHALRLRSHALLRLGRVGEALPVLRELVRLAPDSEEGHTNLALALIELERPAEASEAARAGLELHPDSERLTALLAQAGHGSWPQ